jgi:hypothetical protein
VKRLAGRALLAETGKLRGGRWRVRQLRRMKGGSDRNGRDQRIFQLFHLVQPAGDIINCRHSCDDKRCCGGCLREGERA